MSQPGNYRYQTYDQTGSLKGAIPAMVNGQPAMQHTQNGTQPMSLNSAGTPSSQSSRDPSRETSRDPSPTQYLHTQYRPQLSRPPMPPINGQQPRPIQPSQASPLSSTRTTNNQFPIGQTSNAAMFPPQPKMLPPPSSVQSSSSESQIIGGANAQTPITPMTHDYSSPNRSLSEKRGVQMGDDGRVRASPASQYGQSMGGQNLPPPIAPSSIQSPSFDTRTGRSSEQDVSPTNTTNQPQETPKIAGRWRIPNNTESISNNPQMNSQSYTMQSPQQSQASVAPTGWSKESPSSSIPKSVDQSSSSLTDPNNQTWKNSTPDSSSNDSQSLSYTSMFHQKASAPPRTQPPSAQNMALGPPVVCQPAAPSATSYTHHQSSGNKPTQGGNLQGPHGTGVQASTAMPGINTNMQNVFGNAMPNQKPPGPLASPQSALAKPPTTGQYPPSQLEGKTSTLGASQANKSAYGSQKNVASQWNYAQTGYPSQASTGGTIVTAPRFGGPNVPGVPPTSTGQVPVRPPPPPTSGAAPPPPPGQRANAPYDYRSPYFGQMSNVPLDNMNKRYPTTAYPDQMNQLNAQMGNINVTQTGFNELWGQQSIDLLQCRNVLPSEKIEPPRIKLHQEFLDSINCSPEIFRSTLTKIPETNSLLQKCRLPLGVLIHPFKDLNHLPVIQCSTIVRCRACRTYINPFVYFVDSKRWKCNLCYRVNELPEEFQFDPVTKSYGDPSRRPEVKTSTIEFIAPSEYMLRPPQPAVYLFILDVSRLAVDSGYLGVVCQIIAEELNKLPGDGRTQVGFMAIDSAIHFFSMPENVSQPHEMIMLDVDDVFLPCPDNLIVNLKEREELVRDLLDQLPVKFTGTHDTNNALGAGLQVAFKLMSPTGGRVTVFQTCLPNIGPGALQAREDPNTRASKDVPHLNPATDFYKRLALDCSGQQIAVDLFLLNSQYSDLATLSGMCKFSGGCIYHVPLFRWNKPQNSETLERMLRRYLTRKIGFEAVMRIRCTRGLSIHTFHGNFFVRSTDLLSLPNVNPDAGFGMQVSIEENLADVQTVCFQAALLYTSSKGERRIRVHTLCLPVSSSMSDILYSADQQAIIGLLSKMAVDRSQQSSLSDARDALINVAIDVLSAHKLSQSSSTGGLMAPANLKLLPLYIVALMKSVSFRSGTSTRLDDRVYAMCQMKALPLGQLMLVVYPDLYPVHALDDRNSRDIDGKVCPQAPRLHLSAEKLDFRGVFLMDAGDRLFIYVGKSVDPIFCNNVLGVSAYASIPEELYDLPELETAESERLRNFVFSLQEEKPYYAPLQIIRDDSHFRSLFTDRLIEDRFENALSYYEFLQHLKTQVK